MSQYMKPAPMDDIGYDNILDGKEFDALEEELYNYIYQLKSTISTLEHNIEKYREAYNEASMRSSERFRLNGELARENKNLNAKCKRLEVRVAELEYLDALSLEELVRKRLLNEKNT